MKEIQLNRGYSVTVSDEDYEEVSRHTWRVNPNERGQVYAFRTTRERCQCSPDCRGAVVHTIYMHRVIAQCPNDKFVDHVNGKSLDNTRENLRICTKRENSRNIKHMAKTLNVTRYKGVTLSKMPLAKPWRANIGLKGKRLHLGRFATDVEAAQAYDRAAREHFGEFAAPNFPHTPP